MEFIVLIELKGQDCWDCKVQSSDLDFENMKDQVEQTRNRQTQAQAIQTRIKLKDMPQAHRYNKLKTETKMLMNIIKMICYRAETAVANLVTPY